MREKMYKAFIEGLRNRLGNATAQAILFFIGLEAGEAIAEDLKTNLPKADLDKILQMVSILLFSLGYARIEYLKVRESRVEIALRDNWEAGSLRKTYESPQCFYTKGFLKGLMNNLTERAVDIDEVECEAAGSEKCVFQIRIK